MEAAAREGAGWVFGGTSDRGDMLAVDVEVRCESRNSRMGIESIMAVYFVEVELSTAESSCGTTTAFQSSYSNIGVFMSGTDMTMWEVHRKWSVVSGASLCQYDEPSRKV